MKQGTITVTKIYEFAYAHRLPSYEGKCVQLHGHTGKIELEVARDPQAPAYPGIVVDFHRLKDVMTAILQEIDHVCLNDILEQPRYADWAKEHLPPVSDEQGRVTYAPTSENMLLWVLHRLSEDYPTLEVVRLRWWESSSSYAEWREAHVIS